MVASIVPLTDDQREIVLQHYHLVDVTVSSLAKVYPNIDRDDLRSWASIGLMKAVQHYDPGKECSFATFQLPYDAMGNSELELGQILELDMNPIYYLNTTKLKNI